MGSRSSCPVSSPSSCSISSSLSCSPWGSAWSSSRSTSTPVLNHQPLLSLHRNHPNNEERIHETETCGKWEWIRNGNVAVAVKAITHPLHDLCILNSPIRVFVCVCALYSI